MIVTFDEIKKKCLENRYFAYDSLQDRMFVPVAMYFVWLFIRFGISGNAVSWLSGFVAFLGAVLLTSSDSLIILVGSFGYILWSLLDYVDGAVARFNDEGSVAGQYVDWIMHVIAHIAIIGGITIGAINSTGSWIYPFVILSIVAAGLAHAKFSMAWFAICMERQQQQASDCDTENQPQTEKVIASARLWLWFNHIRKFSVMIFHENWMIFTLPLLAIAHFFQVFGAIDFRVVFTIVAGCVYFPVQVLEIHRLIITKRIQKGYSDLFSTKHVPNLPNDHFFK